jgi:hypothetical protein
MVYEIFQLFVLSRCKIKENKKLVAYRVALHVLLTQTA